MIPILLIVTHLIDTAAIKEFEEKYFLPDQLHNCYGRNNILKVDVENGLICTVFDKEFNEDCLELPDGIYLDIMLTNFPTQVIRGQFKAFNYKDDTQLCYTCPEIGGDTKCAFIQQTEAAQITIKSLVRYTELPIGQIQIVHPDNSNCYDSTRNEVFWSRTRIQFKLYRTNLCPPLGVDFYEQDIKLTTIEDKIVQFTIKTLDEDGNKLYEEADYADYLQITIDHDIGIIMFESYRLLELILRINLNGIEIIKTTKISLLQSYRLPQMYQNPQFLVWASRFTLKADPLENADDLNEQYTVNNVRTSVRYQIFDQTSGETVENIFVDRPAFNFSNIDYEIVCDDSADGGHCTSVLNLLQTYDLRSVSILVTYKLFDSENEIIIQCTSIIGIVENTCWRSITSTYYQDQICATIEANTAATSCAYANTTEIQLTAIFSENQLTNTMNYSVNDREVCVKCSDEECKQMLKTEQTNNQEIRFRFQSIGEDMELISITNYNGNYEELHRRMLILLSVLVVLLGLLITYTILKFKFPSMFTSKRRKQEVYVDELQ